MKSKRQAKLQILHGLTAKFKVCLEWLITSQKIVSVRRVN